MTRSQFVTLTALTAALLTGRGPAQEAAETTPAKPAVSADVAKAAHDGISAMRSRDWKRAAEAWERATKLEPHNAGVWANLGKVQFQLKETAAAIASLEKAVTLQSSLADAWMALGMAYYDQQAPMRAVSCLTRAVHEKPGDARTRNSLAIVMKKIGWTGAAESELQKALDLDPRYAEAHFNLAVMYLDRRPPSLEMARRHYDAARELGAGRDKEMEEQLSGKDPSVDEIPAGTTAVPPPVPHTTPPAQKLPSSAKPPTKPTRTKP